jgi:hypothetical protein
MTDEDKVRMLQKKKAWKIRLGPINTNEKARVIQKKRIYIKADIVKRKARQKQRYCRKKIY